jgi:uncharacterized protein (TIGR03905 family)
MFEYSTQGTCSTKIRFAIEGGKLHDVSFEGGCDGNLQALSRLVEGMEASAVVGRLEGIDCGGKGTSCADQLAKALRRALASRGGTP